MAHNRAGEKCARRQAATHPHPPPPQARVAQRESPSAIHPSTGGALKLTQVHTMVRDNNSSASLKTRCLPSIFRHSQRRSAAAAATALLDISSSCRGGGVRGARGVKIKSMRLRMSPGAVGGRARIQARAVAKDNA